MRRAEVHRAFRIRIDTRERAVVDAIARHFSLLVFLVVNVHGSAVVRATALARVLALARVAWRCNLSCHDRACYRAILTRLDCLELFWDVACWFFFWDWFFFFLFVDFFFGIGVGDRSCVNTEKFFDLGDVSKGWVM